MAGRGQFERLVRAAQLAAPFRRRAGAGLAHGPVAADQPGARPQIIGVDQSGRRHRDEIGVGHVHAAVGIGEAGRLDEQMLRRQAAGLQRRHVKGFQQAEDHADRKPAGTGRPHAADPVGAIVDADRRPFLRLVGREVRLAQQAWIVRRPAHRRHDVGGDRAAVEGVRAAGRDGAQRRRVIRVLQDMADRQRGAVGIVEVSRRRRVALQARVAGDHLVQAGRYRETVRRQPGRRLEQPRPGQRPVPAVRQLEHAQQPGHADRPAADHRVPEAERLARIVREQVGPRRRRRRFAPVITDQPAVAGIVMKHEGAAAESRTLRLHQPQNRLHGDRRVDRRAAGLEDFDAGRHRMRIGRRDHERPRRVRPVRGRRDAEKDSRGERRRRVADQSGKCRHVADPSPVQDGA